MRRAVNDLLGAYDKLIMDRCMAVSRSTGTKSR